MYARLMALSPRDVPSVEVMIREELASGEPGLHVGVIFEEIIDLRTGVVMGHEVLTRVAGSKRITPEAWFAKARTMGMAAKLEARAAELALRALPAGDGMISVNFSPDCLDTPEVVRALDLLADVDRVTVIELSEHHHVSPDVLVKSLAGIRERGLLVAVDDAGAGESGPEFVCEVAPDVIKIDRQHVAHIDSSRKQQAFLQSYVELAGDQETLVVTEGVSNARVMDTLRELGSKFGREFLGQGYWLSRNRIAI